MRGAIPPLPQYVLMAWCLVKHRDFILTWVKNICARRGWWLGGTYCKEELREFDWNQYSCLHVHISPEYKILTSFYNNATDLISSVSYATVSYFMLECRSEFLYIHNECTISAQKIVNLRKALVASINFFTCSFTFLYRQNDTWVEIPTTFGFTTLSQHQ
jgi:hypothetical protein